MPPEAHARPSRRPARAPLGALGVLGACLLCPPASAQPATTIPRAAYQDRLQAMWLGQCIANWTGLRTEGSRTEPPFYTDADWGTTPPGGQPLTFVLSQDPWLADDDTDVEYVYLHLMAQAGRTQLTPAEVRDGWLAHTHPDWVWVSNRRAYDLMLRGVHPPATGASTANPFSLFIDAQLTTEFWGALCPGMPDRALLHADLPIRTTADGFAIHAAQFYALLYALAPLTPPGLSGRDAALWLTRRARGFIPSTSKSADIIDTVLADFLANPDPEDWERTRDLIHARYQRDAHLHGFIYRGWTESSVNFASGVMALLYGRCDYRRTVQIGTLSGWDSDNCTATLGGLIGLMLGTEALKGQFPGQAFSDRYTIYRTKINLPDHLPADPAAEDTFALMAARMMPLVDWAVASAGGSVDLPNDRWVLPPAPTSKPVEANPGQRLWRRSANNQVRLAGGAVVPASSSVGTPAHFGTGDPWHFASGYEHDFRGHDGSTSAAIFFSTPNQPAGTLTTLEVAYDRPWPVHTVRFCEGDHTGTPGIPGSGGWLESAEVQLRIAGQWVTVEAPASEPLDPARPFQIIDFVLGVPAEATGIRIRGPAGGGDGFITCAELDALAPPIPVSRMNSSRP
ncbi:MAG: ADP-ribosylglycohydrolase family protein [Phycisphaerales bacterium]